jgi:hypothetical protein
MDGDHLAQSIDPRPSRFKSAPEFGLPSDLLSSTREPAQQLDQDQYPFTESGPIVKNICSWLGWALEHFGHKLSLNEPIRPVAVLKVITLFINEN